eukprot:TRINITY_DN56112_c0_g1_i1.p1 TRINITY_DN56112_c0_g1~~TRINITY_DN56112_c0_g1_i1.p1  ORF type:complete len:497 (-),score=89.73 TRINITY_DN56112_c0_g1_i1:198-1688(-)
MVKLKVKWTTQLFDVDVDVDAGMAVFNAQLQSLTGVPTDRQKITVMGKVLKEDTNLGTLKLKDNMKILLVGTAEAVPEKPAVEEKFLEDLPPEELATTQLPSGLMNMGNTCYLNSTLQCFRVVGPMRKLLENAKSDDGDGRVTVQLNKLLRSMDSTPEPVTPAMFVGVFRTVFPQFDQQDDKGHHAQQDAEEAWTQLLQASVNSVPPAADGSNPVDNLFSGQSTIKWKCAESDNEPETTSSESWRKLQCHISTDSTTVELGLNEALTAKVEKRSAALDRDAVFLKEAKLTKLPEFLTVQLVRFCWKADVKKKAKILRPVVFPTTIDVSNMCSPELKAELEKGREPLRARQEREMEEARKAKQEKFNPKNEQKKEEAKAEEGEKKKEDGDGEEDKMEEDKEDPNAIFKEEFFTSMGNKSGWYELCGVVTHKGRDSDGGHYVSWVKHKNEWVLFDDNKVKEVPVDEVMKTAGGAGDWHLAYMLLYRTRNDEGRVCGPP